LSTESRIPTARDLAAALEADAPTEAVRTQLAYRHNSIGRVLDSTGKPAEALKDYDKELAIRQKLADTDPTSTEYTNHLGWGHAFRGGAHVRAGHAALAADLRRALALRDKANATDNETCFERSRALALLAELVADGKPGVTKAEARTFADQSIAALAVVVQAGWAVPSELKEPDFDPLRGREDFKKLVAEVEVKAGPKARSND
jgi:hypothetical protein